MAVLLLSDPAVAQEAQWISYPSANTTQYGVYHFRKSFALDQVPDSLKIHISADNRYVLFVNGERVAYGPAKGDLQTYKYDIVNIAPHLQAGDNTLAALVYNLGKDKPMAFLSAQTAFYLNTEGEAHRNLRTDNRWKCYQNPAYTPISYQEMIRDHRWFKGYYACGPGDDLNAAQYPWGWESPLFEDTHWVAAEALAFEGAAPWTLVPRNIPPMADHTVLPKRIRRAEGVEQADRFLENKQPIRVPENTQATLLLDFGVMTMGYPELTVAQGKGSRIRIKYAEALYEKEDLKAHRDSVAGKHMFGVWDIFRPDGQPDRTFRPLWKRAFRYVQLEIETQDEPLEIRAFTNEYSGYPYPEMATFESNDTTLNKIFELSNRTLQMCSGETYYDTPFYEQLSYGGDNRPIMAISTYNSNDDRLLREMLRLYPQSKNSETKLFKSAYPSRFDFDMGSWSLAWVQTLRDYYYTRGDAAFVKQFADDIEGVLGFYHRHMDEQLGILGTVVNKNFIDWSITTGSIPRSNEQGEMTHSALLTLYYAHTLDCVADLYQQLGWAEKATAFAAESEQIKAAVKKHCWDSNRQQFCDYPDQATYSQHTNIMAILCDVLPENEQVALLKNILDDKSLDEYASSYFSFFLFKAMDKTGLEHLFLENLDFWQGFLQMGHTTCGETGFASHDRSDCHAWSAHPSYYLLNLVCGIQPADVGFHSIDIQPSLGHLTSVNASMPHQKGRIIVAYRVTEQHLEAEITLPEGVSGTFTYSGQSKPLSGSNNVLKIKK